jgi:DNA invertase Pin-like site-specific DNA recombinase
MGEAMRTALYARVSTKDKGQDNENQLRQLRRFASTQGWTIAAEYVDRASGKRGDRFQFQKMFEAASRRQFDILLFWSLDRLSREGVVETLNHLQRLTSYAVNYRSFTEQYLDSTGIFKEAVIGILAAVAKQERVRLSERTLAGLERARAQGRIGGRPKVADNPKIVRSLLRLRAGQKHSPDRGGPEPEPEYGSQSPETSSIMSSISWTRSPVRSQVP